MTVTRTVVPGDWYGVLGDDVIVLLPPAAKARVAGLWETVDEGAGFDVVLDALISGGLRELPAFVLVVREGRDVRVVIRGAGQAELATADGPVTVSGSAGTTWVEQNVAGVSGLSVRVGAARGAAYTVGTGLVKVASVEHNVGGARVATPDAEAVAVPVEPPEPVRPKRVLPPDPQLQQADPALATPTPVMPAPPAAPAAPVVPAAPVAVPIEPPGPESPKRILPPDPQLQQPEPLVPAQPEAPPGSPGVPADASFDPLTSPDLAVTPPGSGPVARLEFSSGPVVDVDRPVVVGRAPDQGRFGDDDGTRRVTVPSPHHEISSTHVEIRPGTGADQGSAVVTDLGSTNGTVVVQPGRPAEDLQPGRPVRLEPGATIDLGEGLTIHVSAD